MNVKIRLLSIALLSMLFFSANAKELGNLTTHVTVRYSPPSCMMSLPKEINLHNLPDNIKEHSTFNITITCPDPRTTTALSALAKTRVIENGLATIMSPAGIPDSTSKGPILKLLHKGQYISLNGDRYGVFCKQQNSGTYRTCDITPETTVRRFISGVHKGDIKSTIVFTIIHQA